MPGESRDIVPLETVLRDVLTEVVVVVVVAEVSRLAEETEDMFTEDDELSEVDDEADVVISSEVEADDSGLQEGGEITGALMITFEPNLTGRDPNTTPEVLGEIIRNLCTPLTPALDDAVINWIF